MRLTGKKILIEQELTPTQTEGGIELPDQAIMKLPRGKVTHRGPDCKTILIDDRVIVNSLGGIMVEVAGKEHLLLEEDDVLIILEEND